MKVCKLTEQKHRSITKKISYYEDSRRGKRKGPNRTKNVLSVRVVIVIVIEEIREAEGRVPTMIDVIDYKGPGNLRFVRDQRLKTSQKGLKRSWRSEEAGRPTSVSVFFLHPFNCRTRSRHDQKPKSKHASRYT